MILDERRLAGRIRAGDPQVFRDLYDAYGARLFGYALRLTGCREEAEDLVQETFVASHAGHATFSERGSLLSWLLGIMTRRWRDRIRSDGAAKRPPIAELTEEAGCDPGVEREVVQSLCLERALAELEPAHREALLLVRSQGLTYAETAMITGEPVGTVKWRVFEAARKVQSILGEADGECHEVQREPATENRRACRR